MFSSIYNKDSVGVIIYSCADNSFERKHQFWVWDLLNINLRSAMTRKISSFNSNKPSYFTYHYTFATSKTIAFFIHLYLVYVSSYYVTNDIQLVIHWTFVDYYQIWCHSLMCWYHTKSTNCLFYHCNRIIQSGNLKYKNYGGSSIEESLIVSITIEDLQVSFLFFRQKEIKPRLY